MIYKDIGILQENLFIIPNSKSFNMQINPSYFIWSNTPNSTYKGEKIFSFFLCNRIDQILKIIQITNVQIKTELHQMNEIDVHVSILPLCIIVQDNWWWWVAKNILGGITKGKDTYKCVTCSCNKDLYCQFLFDDTHICIYLFICLYINEI